MNQTLGIIGAEQQEIDLLLNMLALTKKVEKASYCFYCGTIRNYPVVIVKAGVGKVNAAACTQMMIDLFEIGMLINTGAAGSLNAAINIGDVVLSTDVVQHDMDVCKLGYEPGMIPDTGRFFTADSRLRLLAASSFKESVPDIAVWEGRVLTGDQFISAPEQKERLLSLFGGSCAEMEGGAIAQIASLNHVPFLIVRAISDKADGSAMLDYPTFSKMASIHSARMVDALLQKLGQN